MPPEERRRLEELLDAAGRSAQPTDPGWQQLPERLTRRPQHVRRRRRWWYLVAAVPAAAAAAVLLTLVLLPTSPAQAGPVEVHRLDVELTVLSATNTDGETLYMPVLRQLSRFLTGAPELADPAAFKRPPMLVEGFAPAPQPGPRRTGEALVKDHRLVLNLRQGDNVVRFTDVAASIDPTSVRFVSTTDPDGTQVVEQNFEYDLANADALLQRYVEREITCIGKDGQEVSGYLLAHDVDSLALAAEPPAPGKVRATQTLARSTLQAVRLPDVPPDLLVKPTLVWKLRTRTPGRHDTTLSYLCGLIKWQADYVALVTPGDDRSPDLLDLTGWVSLDNNSGSTYDEARLKLIAGDVNRVRDPWAPLPPERLEKIVDELKEEEKQMVTGMPAGGKEFVEKSFFEYHLYTLSAPSTVRDREAKQLNLLRRTAVKAARRYVYDPSTDAQHTAVELVARNDKENGLGLPLPKGRATLEQRDRDGESAFLGSTDIDHTAVKEELTLRYGNAFDVVGEFKATGPRQYEMRVRNHKTHEIQVRAIGHLAPGQRIIFSSMACQPHDAGTVYFDFPLQPNAEQGIAYTVQDP
jgi:hypothetical protein